MKRILVGGAFAAAVVFGAGSPAFAGEVRGKTGEPTPIAGHELPASICSFSGYNDTYSGDPDVPDHDGFTRTQNWGQLPKALRDDIRAGNSPAPGMLEAPNVSCNGSGGGAGH